jgi:hypothetical protein
VYLSLLVIALHLRSITSLSKCSNRITICINLQIFQVSFFAFMFIVDLLVLKVLGEVQWRKFKSSSHFGLKFSAAYFFCIFWEKRNLRNFDEGCEVRTFDSSRWKYSKTKVYFKVTEIETWVDKSKFWSCNLDNKWFCKQLELGYHRSRSS